MKKHWLFLFILFLYTLLSSIFLYLGDLNQDEGFYLLASRLVYQGKVPYRDFAYTQMPLLPYVYGIFQKMLGPGLYQGRITSLIFGFLTLLLVYLTAKNLKDEQAGLIAMALIATNPYQIYFFTIVKTYALASFLLMVSIYFFSSNFNKTVSYTLALIFAILATATRLSIAPAAGLLLLYIILKEIKKPQIFIVPLLAGLLIFWLWLYRFYKLAPENFIFFNFVYHSQRYIGNLNRILLYKIGFVSRLIQNYLAFFILLAFSLFFCFSKLCKQDESVKFTYYPLSSFLDKITFFKASVYTMQSKVLFITIVFCFITIAHISANMPYDDYQTVCMPILAILIGIFLSFLLQKAEKEIKKGLTLLFSTTMLLCLVSAPINQTLFMSKQELIWFLPKKPPIEYLKEIAKLIEQNSTETDLILTLSPYIAVEAKRNVIHGAENAYFSFYPDYPTEECKKLNVLNEEIVSEYIRQKTAKIVAITGYDFSVSSPKIVPVNPEVKKRIINLIEENYQKIGEFPLFGQNYTTAFVYRAK